MCSTVSSLRPENTLPVGTPPPSIPNSPAVETSVVDNTINQIVKEFQKNREEQQTPINNTLVQTVSVLTIELETIVSISDQEKTYIAERKKAMLDRMTEWEKDYKPAPGGLVAMLPGVNPFVVARSMAVLKAFRTGLEDANSREKLVRVLEKNKQIMLENRDSMNEATQKKTDDACIFVDEEITALKKYGPLREKKVHHDKSVFRSEDPYLEHKKSVWSAMQAWRKTFSPSLPVPICWIPGVKAKVVELSDNLVLDFFADVRKAKNSEKLVAVYDRFKGLLEAYSKFFTNSSGKQLDKAVQILAAGKESALKRAVELVKQASPDVC